MAQAAHTFPDPFLWGTSTAGYQVEGNSQTADWWAWERQPGTILNDDKSGDCCDWWEGGRWREDFDRAADDGQTGHRLSIEWHRIEPEPGQWDEAALAYYREIVLGLRQRGLEPLVTLHHFVNPTWFTQNGASAWESDEIVPRFARYVRRVVEALGDSVSLWATINEPNVYFYNGWLSGAFPPGKRDLRQALRVAAVLLRAHAAAYRVIHELQPTALVSLPIHFRPTVPAHAGFFLDEWVARAQFDHFSALFFDALRTGRLRQLLGPALALPEVKGTHDFIGLNYYSVDMVRFDLTVPQELFGRRMFPPGVPVDDAGVYASVPSGMYTALDWVQRLRLPIYITENGIGDAEDALRPRYLIEHLRQVWRGVNFNWDVRGYFHWSLVDNFEWERGWQHRFGLYALDRKTQARTPRRSAHLYRAICRQRGFDTDLVATYAPELVESMFPG
jgi:beta-glucosidase